MNKSKDISRGEDGVDFYNLTSSDISTNFRIFHVKICIFIIQTTTTFRCINIISYIKIVLFILKIKTRSVV